MMKVKLCGFYRGQWICGTYYFLDKKAMQELSEMKKHFVGVIYRVK